MASSLTKSNKKYDSPALCCLRFGLMPHFYLGSHQSKSLHRFALRDGLMFMLAFSRNAYTPSSWAESKGRNTVEIRPIFDKKRW